MNIYDRKGLIAFVAGKTSVQRWMLGLWEFIKRHRGKIVTGVVVAGGAYAIQKVLSSLPRTQMPHAREDTKADFHLQVEVEILKSIVFVSSLLFIY